MLFCKGKNQTFDAFKGPIRCSFRYKPSNNALHCANKSGRLKEKLAGNKCTSNLPLKKIKKTDVFIRTRCTVDLVCLTNRQIQIDWCRASSYWATGLKKMWILSHPVLNFILDTLTSIAFFFHFLHKKYQKTQKSAFLKTSAFNCNLTKTILII